MAMGTQALESGRLIEIDPDHYAPEIQLKRALLTNDQNHYLHAPQETLPAQWEIVELLLEQLARDYPHYFSLTKNGKQVTWHNSLLQEITVFEIGLAASLPYAPWTGWEGRFRKTCFCCAPIRHRVSPWSRANSASPTPGAWRRNWASHF
ncbi:heme-dependent oxidative N-demethylase subunit alpha family protein [Ktedonobacter robiniae]|nr:heme-dependent oxidative N-demethylase subunit alpha family protein [Ktedonobacter robiniae]